MTLKSERKIANIADLYIRVSTDEQADKGYSQRNQEEVLLKYCNGRSIKVRNIIYEDYSAKSFERPQWQKLLLKLKKRGNNVNLILFTKWDRFSRNAGDAYQMIGILRRLSVEPQAIEQPLDLSIPENKMMLAFYLAAPEVENDRRALNTFHGMRRAKKEGRYMGGAPVGYVNKITENGKKYIAPEEPNAALLKWAFTELSRGDFNTEQVWKRAKEKGLTCSKNAFWQAIRNPLYCGKIFIPRYKDEDSYLVEGQHEPIISEHLYNKVQEVLDNRGRKYRSKIKTLEDFPVRGFLTCPECDRVLTGSKSKGRSRYYYYYHCISPCKYRVNSGKINEGIEKDIMAFIPEIDNSVCYEKIIMKDYLKRQDNKTSNEKNHILQQIKDYEERLSHTRDLLATQQIDVSDYREIKLRYSVKIQDLESKLTNINHSTNNIKSLINKGLQKTIMIGNSLKGGSIMDIRKDIGSIYPEKVSFQENQVRTARRNEFMQYIFLINNELQQIKNGTKVDISTLSRQVTPAGFKPATLRAEI
ncbi:recombinase family protein [Salegentibacter sp. Hel_I_6]|uniref:recombinase family protein n=1 Tax=Salegentibacter sp. Hel_I_6 TaxID=1250278 RepID=UPI0009DEABF1|nr:recombinase family protein [Salegentibacter sp. Hel_I_6]